MIELIPVSCSKDCSGGCTLLAHVEDGVLKRITSNEKVKGGTLLAQSGCVNGFQMPHIVYHPQRITRPLIRTGERGSGEFRPASWDEALDTVADRLRRLKEMHGAQSVLNLMGTGSVSGTLHNTYMLPLRFFSFFGGCTLFHSSYSSGASGFAVPYVLGARDRSGFDPATLLQSRLIILWGANVMDTHQGSEMGPRLMQARRNGIPFIAVEPRRTNTIRRLDAEWIPCRPGTDTALMQAVLYVLLEEGYVDWDFVNRYSTGFDLLARHVLGKEDSIRRDPDWAEKMCGTPAGTVASFARQFGSTRPAVLLPGLSIQRTMGGEEAFRMTIALQTAVGNVGKPGGSSGDLNNRLPKPHLGHLPIPDTAPQPSVPVLRWPDAVLEGRAGGYPSDIQAIYSTGGNYLNQGTDISKNIRAFQAVDLAVCHDYFLTPTARFCDVVLPVTTYLERNDIVIPDSGNYLTFSNRAISPLGEVRDDYQIFCALADRLGFGDDFSQGKTEDDWLRSFVADSDVPDYEEFKRSGVFLAADQNRVGMADFVSDPIAHPLPTPSGKIEIASERYHRDTGFPAYPVYRGPQPNADFPLMLITPKSKFRIHSQGSNVAWLREREEQALWMNPADAQPDGIRDGDQVLLGNTQGTIQIKARVTEDIMPGVVCLLEGVWLEMAPDGRDVAGSANMVTSTDGTRPSTATTSNSVPVWVKCVS
ncbi:MAG: molybdopterin-dependent oxidoreductase [Chloroflexi bacterium]|nr:molybdopterin-dependent oxidoreductase [Chloroflexota bacterium]